MQAVIILVSVSALVLVVGSTVGLLLWLWQREQTPAPGWDTFHPARMLTLAPGRYRVELDTPRRFVGPLLDPDIGQVAVAAVDASGLAPGALLTVGGPSWNVRVGVGRRSYTRATFHVAQSGTYQLRMTLGAGREPENIRFRLRGPE